MSNLSSIFGHGDQISALQMCARAILIFFVTLVLIRCGGVRIYGKKSAFDIIIMIMMGAVLARGIVGSSRLDAVIAAATSMIVIHRLIAWLCLKNRAFEILVKGKARIVFSDQRVLEKNLAKESLSKEDFLQSLRLETKNTKTDDIEKAYMETNGQISFVKKEKHDD